MKKLLLFTIGLLIVQIIFCQEKNDHFKKSYKRQDNILLNNLNFQKPVNNITYPGNQQNMNPVIGNTYYDLQTHGTMQNRIFGFDDGTIGAVWMMGMNDDDFDYLGTGYNYYDNYTWSQIPTEPIESENAYFPSYAPYKQNGEIIVAHTDNNDFLFSCRVDKGQGDWNHFKFYGPDGGPGILFPSMVTSGEDNETIHMLALTTPVSHGGDVYEGQDGALLYSRSTDGGGTWNPHHLIIDGIGSDYYTSIKPQTYVFARPKGEIIAFILFDGMNDGIVMKSTDEGDNWSKIEFFDAPWDGGPVPDNTYIFGGGDGRNDICIDKHDNVNIVFGRLCHRMEDGEEYWYPFSNGVVYWNEIKPDVLDTAKIGSDITNPQWLEENGYLASMLHDVDSLKDTLAIYYSSLTGMTQIFADHDFDHMIVLYSSPTPGWYTNNINYRHIWGTVSLDCGNQWLKLTDLTSSLYYLFTESVYPAISNKHNFAYGNYFIFQADAMPGSAVNYNQHEIHENNIVFNEEDIWIEIDEIQSKVNLIVSQNYPNPFTEKSYIKVTISNPCNLSIEITDVSGKLVQLIKKSTTQPGTHIFELNGKRLDPGIYLYTVASGRSAITKKMIVY